jgi:CARDB
MRRALITATLIAAGALPAAAVAASKPASVKLVKCSVQDHQATFYGRMRQVSGTARMAMRFTLLEKTGSRKPRRVKAPGLLRWRVSKTGVAAFKYRQGFRGLPENASHRVRVDFRWYGSDGGEIARATRRSRWCDQFVALPNLTATLTGLSPARADGVVRYEALVSNTGRASATAVPVRLTVDGKVVDTVTLASLGPGERRQVAIRGPDCSGLVRLEADPDRAIAESSDADNASELTCAALRNIG